MVFRKGVTCFGGLLVFFIIFGLSLLIYSEDASCASLGTQSVQFDRRDVPAEWYYWSSSKTIPGAGNAVGDSSYISNVMNVRRVRLNYSNFVANGNHLTLHFETNIVKYNGGYSGSNPQWVNLDHFDITAVSTGTIESSSISYATTSWDNGNKNTLTIYGDLVVSGLTANSTISGFYVDIGSIDYAFMDTNSIGHTYVWVEQNPSAIYFSNDLNNALLNQQVAQNEVMINIQNQMVENQSQMIQNQNEYYDANYDAVDNISEQSTSDIPNSSMTAQTMSLINAIGQFFRTLSSYQATSCSLTLPFPNYAGGSTTVDPCSGKEIAPTIVQVASSLLLICTFIPLAFIILRMIYNEIRSWTNG